MRKYLFFAALLLVGCSNSGVDSAAVLSAAQLAPGHKPEITDLTILPEVAMYMEGDGSVDITVEVGFKDTGLDIQALRVQMPDGTNVEFSESFAAETGTFTEDIAMSTNQIGTIFVEIWLVDEAGNSSNAVTARFQVVWTDTQASDWTNRLSGLPGALVDVAWNGSVFIAVGDPGAIFTSADGINWLARDSGTDASLNAVAADGPYVVVVGWDPPVERGIILQSTDHGASWTVKDRPIEARLEAVAISPSQVVVGGHRDGWNTAIAMISEDRGDTWQAVDSWPDEDLCVRDLVYRDGLFVAATYGSLGEVAVSSDGKTWSAIEVSDEAEYVRTIIHDDSQFILAGSSDAIFTSSDGFNWTQLQTPVLNAHYAGAAWNGSRLVLAGTPACGMGGFWWCDPQYVPNGLSSTDGGMTWEFFNIDSDYASWGLVWGNGRFVSVGAKPAFTSEGAIYTTD